jgi:hypothetical protein
MRVLILPLVAVPPESVTGDPKLPPSTTNCTVPVRVPDPGATAVTVAVKVTDSPTTDGLADKVTVVVVEAWFTVCGTPVDVLLLKLLFPA